MACLMPDSPGMYWAAQKPGGPFHAVVISRFAVAPHLLGFHLPESERAGAFYGGDQWDRLGFDVVLAAPRPMTFSPRLPESGGGQEATP